MLDTETLSYVAADGAESALTVHGGDALEAGSPVLIAMPAMGVRASFYAPLAGPLAEAGLRLATCDLRGHGKSSVRARRGVDFGYREMVELDWPAAISAVRGRYPGAAVTTLGHSLGGQVSLLHAASFPGSVDAVLLVATASVYWRAYPGSLSVAFLIGTQLIGLTGFLLGSYPGHRLGFGGHEARRLVADWAHQARTGRYRARGCDRDFEAALARMETPCLLITVAGDRFAPASAADHLAAKLPATAATRIHIEDERLRHANSAHFGWVSHPAPIVAAIAGWLEERGLSTRPREPARGSSG